MTNVEAPAIERLSVGQETFDRDVAALRRMRPGGSVETANGWYSMQGETVRGEGRWHSLEWSGGWVDTPDSGRPDAVRRAAVRHYRERLQP